jgi:hypothetical protein
MYSIRERSDKTTIKWREHIAKMEEDRLPKAITICKPRGMPLQGRP